MKNQQQNQNPNDERSTGPGQQGSDRATPAGNRDTDNDASAGDRASQRSGASGTEEDREDELDADNSDARGGSTNPNSRRGPSDVDTMRTERGRPGSEKAAGRSEGGRQSTGTGGTNKQ